MKELTNNHTKNHSKIKNKNDKRNVVTECCDAYGAKERC